jgi:hypothetical protein
VRIRYGWLLPGLVAQKSHRNVLQSLRAIFTAVGSFELFEESVLKIAYGSIGTFASRGIRSHSWVHFRKVRPLASHSQCRAWSASCMASWMCTISQNFDDIERKWHYS